MLIENKAKFVPAHAASAHPHELNELLLRSGASADLPNNNGKTPLNIARERGYHLCEELVSGLFPQFSHHINLTHFTATSRSRSEEDNV